MLTRVWGITQARRFFPIFTRSLSLAAGKPMVSPRWYLVTFFTIARTSLVSIFVSHMAAMLPTRLFKVARSDFTAFSKAFWITRR